MPLRVFKKETLGGVLGPWQRPMMKFYFAEVVNVIQRFAIFAEKAALYLFDIILNMPLFFLRFLLQYFLIV